VVPERYCSKCGLNSHGQTVGSCSPSRQAQPSSSDASSK
jgi:hypothetical protein